MLIALKKAPSSLLRILTALILATICYFKLPSLIQAMPSSSSTLSKEDYADGKKRAQEVATRINDSLTTKLSSKSLSLGDPVFIRIFKQSRELELWIKPASGDKFQLFETYPIVAMSGKLGPKLAEGDKQAPEGFYFVSKPRMNPQSRYHLAFNIGYPNTYDQAHKRTGSALMVHGNQVSIGCFAMTDEKIEEIYTICDAALNNDQTFFRVHSFPFRLTKQRLDNQKDHKWHSFWTSLKPGYDHFENDRRPPNVLLKDGEYRFENTNS